MNIHTAADAVPSLDGSELGGVLEDLAGFHPGIDLIRDGLRLIALDRLTVSQTQTLIAVLAGGSDGLNLVAAIGHLVARLADADSNPALRALPIDQQKTARRRKAQRRLLAHRPRPPPDRSRNLRRHRRHLTKGPTTREAAHQEGSQHDGPAAADPVRLRWSTWFLTQGAGTPGRASRQRQGGQPDAASSTGSAWE
jgi:hypothetical protein